LRYTCRLLNLTLSLSVFGISQFGMRYYPVFAQTARPKAPTTGNAVTIRADTQEANSKTGVITARGNVQVFYPSRQIQATSAQAQYFSRERRIVMTGNVYVLQAGNSLRGEMITYLMDEARFVATPRPATQVESIYLVQDASEVAPAPKPVTSPPVLRPLSLPSFSTPAPSVPKSLPSPSALPLTPNFANP
jgi:lipopolysaccharide export system protein LptA